MENWLFHFLASNKGGKNSLLCHYYGIIDLLIALVTNGEPTPTNYHMHDVGTPNGADLGNKWQMHSKTRSSPTVGFLLPFVFVASKKSLRFFWCLILWMLSIGRARHPGPCIPSNPSGFSIEFLNVGGWLSRGDLALESKAHFLAVAEHRLVPARARNVTTQLHRAPRSSVWAPSCQDVTPGGHAGVGVISLYGASLSLPTFFDPSFKEFFLMGRAMRVVLPLGNGGIAHLFVVYGYQGAESDLEKLQLSEHLFAAVLLEAKMCCAGQPVILVGDFNADPNVIPSLAKGIMNGHWIDVEQAFAPGRGLVLPVPANSSWTKIRALEGFSFGVSHCYGGHHCMSCFARPLVHLALCHPHGVLTLCMGRHCSYGQSLYSPHRSRRSPSPAVQNIWDVYIQEVSFVLREVREQLFSACDSSDVDASWHLWSREPEACLARAYLTAGGPALLSPGSYVGKGQLSSRTKRLGGRCRDRIYRMNRADEFNVTHSGFFVNSSLAPVLRFWRRFVSVCYVLKGIKVHGFSETRVIALWHRFCAVVRMGPTGPVTSFEPWTHWIPPDLHGFCKWAVDTLALLNEFVLKVVHHRQTARLQAWSNWIREDLTSHRLRPEFVPLAPYLVCNPQDSPTGSGILVQPALIDAHFRKAWMPYFRRDGHPVVTPQAFLDFVGDHLPQEALLDLPILTGEELYEAAMAKKSTAGGLDGWAWNEIQVLSLSW